MTDRPSAPQPVAGLAPVTEREAFEVWATDERLDLNRNRHSYLAVSTAWCWDAWQAATKSNQPALDAAVAAARAEERAKSERLRITAQQVLRDMQAQDVLWEWQSLLDDAIRAATPKEPTK